MSSDPDSRFDHECSQKDCQALVKRYSLIDEGVTVIESVQDGDDIKTVICDKTVEDRINDIHDPIDGPVVYPNQRFDQPVDHDLQIPERV